MQCLSLARFNKCNYCACSVAVASAYLCVIGQDPHIQGWPEPYIYGVYTVFLAGKSPNIRSYTVYTYSYGQPYSYTTCIYNLHHKPGSVPANR
jgi:hypothetical protein